MSKITRTSEGAKKISFFPFQNDINRLQIFSDLLAKEEGLHVRPTQREVFRYILNHAEVGLAARQSSNGSGHAPEPPPASSKRHKKAA